MTVNGCRCSHKLDSELRMTACLDDIQTESRHSDTRSRVGLGTLSGIGCNKPKKRHA